PREWRIRRPRPERDALAPAVRAIRAAKRPVIVAGGGVLYSGAEDQLRALVEATGIPVGTSQAGGGVLAWDHPQYLGGVGATGTLAANRIAAEADVVVGIGTRYSDFTTASRTAFQNPDVTFVNVNVTSFDASKQSAISVVGDARSCLLELSAALAGYRVAAEYSRRYTELATAWHETVDRSLHLGHEPLPAQTEILGALDEVM